jgi:diadenosine tetraphosphate (Ap4A) HIT family hydrolase
LGKVSRAISKACLQALKCKGTTIFMANGAAAGQVAQHFTIHIIPRYEKGDIPQLALPKHSIEEAQLEQLTEQLRQYIEQKLNIKIPEEKETKEEPKERVVEEKKEEKLKREPGYLYFLDKELNIKRVKSGRKKGSKKKTGKKATEKKEVNKEKVPDLDDISRLFT